MYDVLYAIFLSTLPPFTIYSDAAIALTTINYILTHTWALSFHSALNAFCIALPHIERLLPGMIMLSLGMIYLSILIGIVELIEKYHKLKLWRAKIQN